MNEIVRKISLDMRKITTTNDITVDKTNFITDDKTNKVYVSSLIDTSTGGLDISKEDSHKLKECIMQASKLSGLLYNTRDVWARDYMPIQLTEDIFLSYIYKPDYLNKYPTYVTNWDLHGVNTKEDNKVEKAFNGDVVHIPLILDGGNVVKAVCNGQPCMIMCNKVLKENNVSEVAFRLWWDEWWGKHFNGTKMGLILLPWVGKRIDPIGHADGMVRYIGEGRILMANYYDFDKKEGDALYGCLKNCIDEKNIIKLDFHKFWEKHKEEKMCRDLFHLSWCYINYLHVGNNILVPSLGYPELDNEALVQIRNAFSTNAEKTEIKTINVDMTHIVSDVNEFTNSGGALNCLTWTIKA
ncbi:MAG: agmatine deiminase family protein [Prevotella sp.]|nr:agmatine deiminase family protein [Prevotella sp.]